jgi:guanine deaminase
MDEIIETQAFRGEILHFTNDPTISPDDCCEYFSDGLLVVEAGHVARLGAAADLLPGLGSEIAVTHYREGLILPGFIDTHIHYPQTEMIASFGEQLLGWLENYAFPAEARFADYEHACEIAEFFIKELLKNGGTYAATFSVYQNQMDFEHVN